jgi:short-subunit dehydrogenase
MLSSFRLESILFNYREQLMKDTRPQALITGASSGLGSAFASQLAAQGYDLILVARRREALASLAARLTGENTITAEVLSADLSTESGIHKVEERIRALEHLDLLINNAGFGLTGEFARQPLERSTGMLQVHCTTPVRLACAALPDMIAHRKGVIINVASISAFAPMVGNVMYSATKAFLVVFSRALQIETRQYGIHIQALCPGFFHSEFHDVARVDKLRIPQFLFMRAEEVAKRSLSAIQRKGVVYIPGIINKLVVFFAGLPGVGNWATGYVSRQVARKREDFLKG